MQAAAQNKMIAKLKHAVREGIHGIKKFKFRTAVYGAGFQFKALLKEP